MAAVIDPRKQNFAVATAVTLGMSYAAQFFDSDANPVAFSIFWSAFLFQLNWALRIHLVHPFSKAALGTARASLVKRVDKFSQSVMEILNYGAFTYIGYSILKDYDFVYAPREWMKIVCDPAADSEARFRSFSGPLKAYYLIYGARYVQATISVLLEVRRSDFLVMLLHHVVTLALVIGSFATGQWRIGAVIMLLFDPADVPLHSAKLAKYVSPRIKFMAKVSDFLFLTFMVVFLVTRLVAYPYVIYAAIVYCPLAYRDVPMGHYSLLVFLFALLFIQIYWEFLIIKVLVRVIRGDGAEDNRSDSDEE